MGTVNLKVAWNYATQRSIFVKDMDVKYETFKATKVKIDGWECFINPNGTIVAKRREKNENGTVTCYRLVVRATGYSIFTRKNEDGTIDVLKKGFVNRNRGSMKNGVLVLFTDEEKKKQPYASFRNMKFQKVLNKYKISSVTKRKRENFIFNVRNAHTSTKDIVSKIYTDGDAEVVDERHFEFKRKKFYDKTEKYVVRDATFVVIEINGEKHLYTDVNDITTLDLRKILKK